VHSPKTARSWRSWAHRPLLHFEDRDLGLQQGSGFAVCDRPRAIILARSAASPRSIVAALVATSKSGLRIGQVELAVAAQDRHQDLQYRRQSLPAGARRTAQHAISATMIVGPDVGPRGRRSLTTFNVNASPSAARASSRCHPVNSTSSSRTAVFVARSAPDTPSPSSPLSVHSSSNPATRRNRRRRGPNDRHTATRRFSGEAPYRAPRRFETSQRAVFLFVCLGR
jgi:hypothetical protein